MNILLSFSGCECTEDGNSIFLRNIATSYQIRYNMQYHNIKLNRYEILKCYDKCYISLALNINRKTTTAVKSNFILFYKYRINQILPMESIACKTLCSPWGNVTKLPLHTYTAPITPPLLTAIHAYRTAAMSVSPRTLWTAGAEWPCKTRVLFKSCLPTTEVNQPHKRSRWLTPIQTAQQIVTYSLGNGYKIRKFRLKTVMLVTKTKPT